MSFRILEVKSEYRSFQDNVVEDFYIPVLEKAIRYDRAVGFFSSTSISDITKGIIGLVKNNGKIRIITSPKLSEEDIEAIKFGYKKKEEIINDSLCNVLQGPLNEFQKRRLNLLATLIARGVIEIKIALIDDGKTIGMFHEKMGIIEDFEGNKIAFTGSLNETTNAFNHNYESIDLYKSWTFDNEKERVSLKEKAFEDIWNNNLKNVNVFHLSEIAQDILKNFEVDNIDTDIDEDEMRHFQEEAQITEVKGLKIPEFIQLREYQNEAIDKWEHNQYRGIFDMATGTGKTITGLAAASYLSEKLRHNIAIVIVCPYQHLVEQWVEDIKNFNVNPIIGYSSSSQKGWKRVLKNSIRSFNQGVIDNFLFITTNATFSLDYIQSDLKKINHNLLLIVDEAHNFGSENLGRKLLENADFRLGLSATIQRHNDEEGTNTLFNYFGDICLEYTLRDAIFNNMLTPYFYYPVIVHLSESELEEYKELTLKIVKSFGSKNKSNDISESAKHLLIKRARIIAGAENKIHALEKEMIKHTQDSNILVYCGATTVEDPNYIEGEIENIERRQIDVVTNLLGNKLKMNVGRFTSTESVEEREMIKRVFAEGEALQALVAIRCLDEGVNIPSIKTAFILASSTNPKEYIQRRGRVLRLYPGKEVANIYDFITLPYPLDSVGNLAPQEISSLKGLAKREVDRMKDFAELAMNASASNYMIDSIMQTYNLYEEGDIIDEPY